jgi:protein SCO1/2
VPTLELTANGGEAVFLPNSLQGKLSLVFFGYTNCPDVCPLTMAQLARTYEDLGEPEELRVIMVTVDPERDTPKVVDDYAKRFHRDFLGLGGDPDTIARAAEAFFVGHHDHESVGVTHSGHVTLLDREARIRRIYTQDNVPHLRDDLEHLLARARW